MKYFIGLDVSKATTAVCILDQIGNVVREHELMTDPDHIAGFLEGCNYEIDSIALETGSMTHALCEGLMDHGYKVKPLDARQVSAFLKAKTHKNDRNDARIIADLCRIGNLQPVHHKSQKALEIKTVLKARKQLVSTLGDIKNTTRGLLKHHGLKLSGSTRGLDAFISAVREAITDVRMPVKEAFEELLKALESIKERISKMEKLVNDLDKAHKEITDLLKSCDGIGTLTALSFIAEIDDPNRFTEGRDVGAYIGCVPTLYESGERSVRGRISKTGPEQLRSLLFEASLVLLTRTKRWSHLKAWGMKIAKKKGMKKASIAVARKLSIILWRMWKDGKPFHHSLKEAKELEMKAKNLKKAS